MEKIRIVHTNDLHSHFENWPRIRRFLLSAKDDHSVDEILAFDLGDFMDRSHPLSEATEGQANIELLNTIGYDAVTIGNNEGISNSHEVLERLFNHANFDVILGNLREPTGELPKFAKTHKIITTKNKTRIAVLGLTAAYPISYEPNGWKVQLITDALPKLLKEVEGQYDYLILLSHLGITMDRYLAEHYPALDLIIGSHTHHLLENGEFIKETAIAAADKWGRFIGNINLEFDEHHQIVKTKVETIKTDTLQEEQSDDTEVESYIKRGQDILKKEKVAFLPESFNTQATMIENSLHAIANFADTDLAILSSGLFVKESHSGLLTRNDLHQILPHPMHVVKLKLRGEDLWRLMMEMEKNRPFLRNFKVRGMSFRGKVFGNLAYLGIKVDKATRTVYVHDQEVDIDKIYTIAILDHYVFIPFFPTIEIMGEKEFIFPNFLRDVIGNYLAKKYPVKED